MDFGKLDFKSQNVYLLKSNFKVTVLYSSELLNLFIKSNVEIFLNGIWANRGLKGATPEEAYTVKCDAEINNSEAVEAGRTYCDIGLALNRPNEFTIFRLNIRS